MSWDWDKGGSKMGESLFYLTGPQWSASIYSLVIFQKSRNRSIWPCRGIPLAVYMFSEFKYRIQIFTIALITLM